MDGLDWRHLAQNGNLLDGRCECRNAPSRCIIGVESRDELSKRQLLKIIFLLEVSD
jgi:hypothetical protein